MSTSEQELKERIKELTCLYEVSSIIVNADLEHLDETFKAIALSIKKAFQYPEITEVSIQTPLAIVSTGNYKIHNTTTQSNIRVFNEPKGVIIAYLKTGAPQKTFLHEELLLLDNIALKIGNLLEHVEIKNSELFMKRQMERADRLSILGEITAGIAHELNTPLANILGFAELLSEKLENDPIAHKDVSKIITNAIFSREVVKKLMFFACEMPQEMKPINIVNIIEEAIKLLEPAFQKKELKYLLKIEEETLMLRADTVQVTQILFNLLMNAIYFSPKNGLVTLEASQNKKHIVLSIKDEGKGLTNEDLQKVFQPFYTTKPVGEGSGLGLSVVHGIVASHKGTITAKNNIKKGAIFEVHLPK